MVGIETSQHVKLNYEPAGVGERVLAFFLDGFFIGVYFLVGGWIWGYLKEIAAGSESILTSNWLFYLLVLIPILCYHLISEILSNGYSPGKKIVGIRVINIDGTRASLSGFLIRWLFRLVEISMTSGVLAFVTVIMNGKGQRIGDILAKTCVINERKKVKLDQTILEDLEESYEPRFKQVTELRDEDIRIVREVLNARSKYEYDTWFKMLQRTRELIEKKLGISDHGMRTDEFLKTVVKDYNVLHGK